MEFTLAAAPHGALRFFSVVRNSLADIHLRPASFGAAFSLMLLAANGAQATTAVGAIPGSAGVTANGAATYSIPINIPSGTHGMQPSVSLAYNSQEGREDIAGYDWGLGGLSTIERCRRNPEDDNGNVSQVLYAHQDDYCLDGQRLRLVSGTYAGDGSTYATQIEGFTKITAHWAIAPPIITGGPSWFTVERKDGRVYEYGNTPDSKILTTEDHTVVRTWALDKVTDAAGNYMTYQYQQDASGDDYWLQYINYTGNGSTVSPDHQIEFDYTARPAPSGGAVGTIRGWYISGSLTALTQLLTAIKIKYAGSTTSTYTLTYTNSPGSENPSNKLATVTECGADGSCLPPTQIAWENGLAGWTSDTSTGVQVSDASHAAAAHLMDVDGDGIMDLVYPGTADWAVMFGLPGGGFTGKVDTGYAVPSTASYYQNALAMDYNGDGRMDLAIPTSSGWQMLVATGSRTAGQGGVFNSVSNNLPSLNSNNSVTGLPIYQGNVWTTDFSSGSLSDMVYTDGSTVSLLGNGGPSGGDVFSSPQTIYSNSSLKQSVSKSFVDIGMNFDGSGRGNALVLKTNTGTSPVSYSWQALVSNNLTPLTLMDSISAGNTPAIPFDANGDGLTDLVTSDTSGNWQISLSTGTGFVTIPTGNANDFISDVVVADYWGDGRQEVFTKDPTVNEWHILQAGYAPGTGFVSETWWTYPATPSNYVLGTLRIGNIESNGLDDLVYAVTSGSTFVWHYNLHNGGPTLVTSITDGFGNTCQFQYGALASGGALYTKGSSAVYPVQDVQNTMQVVSSYTETDGIGGTYSINYTYSGAQTDTQGHGFLGFASRTITDSRTGNVETISYAQNFPFTGMVTQDVLKKSGGTLIRETDNTGANQLQFGTGTGTRYFPYFNHSVTHDYDTVAGTVQETRTTTKTVTGSDFDSYGNMTHALTTVIDKTRSGTPSYTLETEAAYAAPSSSYCAALPTSVSVTSTVPAGTLGVTFPNPASRITTYNADVTNCRINSKTVASGQSGDGTQPLTTAYQYDTYGNVSETDVSGSGLTTHVTQASFANQNGEFPVSQTHVVSGSVSLVSHATWRYDFGVPATFTDPNGNQTSITYDGFARRTQVTKPDGSSIVFTYNGCSAVSTYCPAGAAYEITTSQVSGTTSIVTGYTAYDMRSRVIEQGSVLLGGVISRADISYDAMGNVIKASKPYIDPAHIFNTSYSYDLAMGRVTEIDTPQDGADTCSPSCLSATTFTYSGFTSTASHSVTNSVSSSATQTSSQTRDAVGQVLNVVDANYGQTTYNYDAFGDLVATQDANNKLTTMTYDGLGHKIGMVDPNLGTWSYQVDALGEVICQTDAKSQSIIMAYDALGRPVSKLETAAGDGCSASTGTLSTWTYDTATDGLGLPASVTDSNGFERDYAYDSLSRPSDVTTTIESNAYTVSTTYDGFGRIATISYPESVTPTASGTAPTANAGADSIINLGSSATLDGGSSSPLTATLQFQWSQTSGPSTVSFDPAAESQTITPSVAGSYVFQLKVIDTNTSMSSADSVTVTVKPLAPSSAPTLSPNPSTNGNVTVSWSAVTGASSYVLYRSTTVGGTYTSVQSGITGTSASDTGLSNGTYYYKVASTANGVTGDMGSASAALTVTLPPGAPTGMNVTPAFQAPSTNYTASWTAPASGTVTTYQLLEDTSSSFPSPTTIVVTAPTTSKIRSKATAATYYYKVQACNGTACGAFSGTDHVVVEPVPLAPSLSASPGTITSGGSSTLSWTKHSGDTVTSYTLQSSTAPGFSSPTTVYTGSLTSKVVNPVLTKYYRVQACNDVGCGSWSTVVTVTVNDGGSGFAPMKSGDPMAAPEMVADASDPGSIEIAPDGERLAIAPSMPETPLAALSPVALPPRPVEAQQMTVATTLTQERQQLISGQPLQPSEASLQARLDHLNQGMDGTALVMNRPGTSKPGPVYAPPVYKAYAGAKIEKATGTPYRFTVVYSYDPASGGLEAVSNADTGFIYWRPAMSNGVAPVDAFGHIIGYVDGNNVSTVSAYDQATGATTGISTGVGSSTSVQQLVYSWDGFGNLKQRCDVNQGLTEGFTYDDLNRIASTTVRTGASACAGGTTGPVIGMTYDAMGNIQTRTNTGITVGSGTLSDTYTYGDSSHPYAVTGVTSTGTYAYDANGNMTSGNGRTITWNDDNLPTSITSSSTVNGNNTVTGSSTFSYGPDLQRYKQVTTDSVAGNSTTVYVGGLFEVVTASGTTQYRHNIMAAGAMVAVHTLDASGNATTSYLHPDHLGGVDAITGDAGTVTQQMSFDAFGLRRNPTTWAYSLTNTAIAGLKSATDRGFTLQEQLDSVGLVHMNGRVYDPSIGRMISADPAIPDPLFSQSFGRYNYVDNNPLNATDPSGFDGDNITFTITGSKIPGVNGTYTLYGCVDTAGGCTVSRADSSTYQKAPMYCDTHDCALINSVGVQLGLISAVGQKSTKPTTKLPTQIFNQDPTTSFYTGKNEKGNPCDCATASYPNDPTNPLNNWRFGAGYLPDVNCGTRCGKGWSGWDGVGWFGDGPGPQGGFCGGMCNGGINQGPESPEGRATGIRSPGAGNQQHFEPGNSGYWHGVLNDWSRTNHWIIGSGPIPPGSAAAVNLIGRNSLAASMGFPTLADVGAAFVLDGSVAAVGLLAPVAFGAIVQTMLYGGIFQGGVFIGSMIDNIPIGNGMTIEDGISNTIENLNNDPWFLRPIQ